MSTDPKSTGPKSTGPKSTGLKRDGTSAVPLNTEPMSADVSRARMISRLRLVTIVIPAVLTAAVVMIQLVLSPTLADPVAIHWGPGGQVDGFAAAWTVVVLTVVAGFVAPAAIGLALLRGLRQGDQGLTYRFLGALAAGLSVLIAVLSTWSLVLQRGLTDAADAPPLTTAVVVASVLALVGGGVGWLLQPHAASRPAPAEPAQAVRLEAGQEAVWLRTASMGGGFAWVMTVAIMGLALGTIAAWVLPADPVTPWILTGTLVLVVVAAAATGAFRVRADRRGLTVTSLLGWPRLRARLEDIESVGVAGVDPIGEFGGVGLRRVPGRVGVVMGTGEAIQVIRRGAPQLVVTVDDAATATAVLSAYLQRAEEVR